MKSEYISWRYVLWCFAELKEGEWITAKNFVELFNVPLSKVYHHIYHLKRYKNVQCRYKDLGRWVFGINENRIKEYQITSAGRKKIEKWGNHSFVKKKDKIVCPNCGFNANVKEFEFVNEVVSEAKNNKT